MDKIPPDALTDASSLFVMDQRKRTRVDYNSLQQTFVREREKAGLDFEVYNLKSYFSTNVKASTIRWSRRSAGRHRSSTP